jgi:alkanesulfonate monooxygenase SsuD/methylene tetrahydromethanopterin reductase-like flavin-dependent oxidoreductase (luciferase family)
LPRLFDELTATGTPDEVLAALKRVVAAGADSIAIAPLGPNHDEQLQLLAQNSRPSIPTLNARVMELTRS